MKLKELHDKLVNMGGESTFNMNDGVIAELLGNDDRVKMEIFIYLLIELAHNFAIRDDEKNELVGMIASGLNIVLHGDLYDDVR